MEDYRMRNNQRDKVGYLHLNKYKQTYTAKIELRIQFL